MTCDVKQARTSIALDRKFCNPSTPPSGIFKSETGPRAICPVCGMPVAVTKAGTFARHSP